MVVVSKPIKNIYLWAPDPLWEFSYDCRWWSSAGFLEAGWKNIDWNCWFDSSWAYISSSWYDQRFAFFWEFPDLSTANKITISETAYYQSWSWSNNKRCWVCEKNSRSDSWNNWFRFEMPYNSSSPWTYNGAWLHLSVNWTETWFPQRYYEWWWSWDIEVTFEIDLYWQTVTWTVTWANTKNYTWNLTNSQTEAIRSWKYWYFQKEEWYQYRWERLKTLYVKVEY